MKALFLPALVAGLMGGAMAMGSNQPAPLKTVDRVDLKRYAGQWYEIARYPNRFQRDCESDTTANYTLRADGKVKVVNVCRQKNGSMKTARGSAKIADTKTNARLKVTFFWPFYGDYWIIGLGSEYEYAIVGEPDRKYLWILSRKPVMDSAAYDRILQQVKDAGYDPARLMKTKQTE